MQERLGRDEAGNLWVIDAQGNPIRPHNASSAVGPVIGGNPKLPYEVQQAQGQAAAAPYAAPKAQADARSAEMEYRIKAAEAQVASAKNQTDLQIAQANLQKTQAELAALQSGKGGAMKALQDQVDRVNSLFQRNVQGGLPNGLNNFIPDMLQPGKAQFDTAGQGLTNPFMSAFRVPGAGSQSDTELLQFIRANVPQQGDSDAVIAEKLKNIQTRIDAEKPAQTPVAPTNDAPQFTQSGGETRSEIDPALQALGKRIGRMVSNGVGDKQILDFLRQNGVDPAKTNIGGVLQFRKTPDFKNWLRGNPGQAYPIGPEFYTKEIPLTGARKLFNKTAATDAGGATAAGIVAAGDAMLAGRGSDLIGALSGDPQMAETGMQLLRTNHPTASVAGDIAGQALFEGTLGRIPGANALMATRWGRRGADALYGGAVGSQDGPEGVISGAIANMTGGMVGRGVQRGAGRALTGVRNANLGYLDQAGVPLTIGQIARGSDNVVGRAIGGLEERAAGLPGMDAVVATARQRGDRGFNAAAFREMGGSGQTGAAGVLEGQNLVNNAYSFLDPLSLPYDAQFAGSQAGVRANLPRNLGAGVADRLDNIDNATVNGSLSGRSWQDGIRGVRADRASLRGQPFSEQAINSLDAVEGNLQDLALRQGPPGTAANLANANRLNGQFQTLVSALDNGPAQKADELFSAGRLDDASRANARNFGGRTASIAGNRPFYDLTTAGKAVMPNLTPDSGTAGRILLVPAAAGAAGSIAGFAGGEDNRGEGAGTGLGAGLALAGILAAPYTNTGQRVIQRALLHPRSARVTRIGDIMINNPRLGGMFGAALARDLGLLQELPE